MKKLNIILLIIILLPAVACSVAGKHFYYEPQPRDPWRLSPRAPYKPIAEIQCNDAVIRMYSAPVGELVYSMGPLFLPIFPTFGMFDKHPDKQGFKFEIVIEGTRADPGIDQDILSLMLGQSKNIIQAGDMLHSCHKPLENGTWYCDYQFIFRAKLDSISEFTAVVNRPINSCNIQSLSFARKDNFYYIPFFLPLPGEAMQ